MPGDACARFSGDECSLCGRPTFDSIRDGSKVTDAKQNAQQYGGIAFEQDTVHLACANWAGDSQIRCMCDDRELRRMDEVRKISVRSALANAKVHVCSHCDKHGASVLCANLCGKRQHLHCLRKSGCDIVESEKRATCADCKNGIAPAQRGSLPANRRVEASQRTAADGSARPLRGPDPSAARKPLKTVSANAIAAGKISRAQQQRQQQQRQQRAPSQRKAAQKPVNYAEPPLNEFGSSKTCGKAGVAEDGGDESDAEVHEFEENDDDDDLEVHVDSGKPSRPSTRQVAPAANARGRTRAAATDRWGNESEEDDDGDDDGSDKGSSDDDEDSYGGARQQWRPSLARKSQRKRVKTITFDEDVAIKAAQAAAIAAAAKQAEKQKEELTWEDQACTRCNSKEDGADTEEGPMLLCDGCNKGTHMRCLKPPLEEVPEGSWHCAYCASRILCEVCAVPAVKGAPGMGRLVNCGGHCGARCHSACLSEEDSNCPLCMRGFTSIKTILGCREGRKGAGELQYYIRWTGRPFRDACWVGATAVRRISKERIHAFHNKHRGALHVEPEVQSSWSEVSRVIAVRNKGEEVLVKWKGLDYGECTWEAVDSADDHHVQEYRKRLGLRVAGKARSQALELPLQLEAYVPQKLLLKDYQIEGVNWLLGKLQDRQNVILGDEMGLGKTIQAATLLAAAYRERLAVGPAIVVAPLSTIGSWERELAKWAPELAVLPYIGGQAAREIIQRYEIAGDAEEAAEAGAQSRQQRRPGLVPRFHVLLTTFELASKDQALLRKFDWSAQIIDEGHRLKSETSQVSTTLSNLSADWRCIMTGTPLQNELNELFCLLAFVDEVRAADIERLVEATPDPAALTLGASAANAMQVGEDDEEGERDEAAYARKLHAFLAPRMLRRLKHNVASLSKELPPKITRKVACRLSPLQRQLYVDILARNFAAINARATGSSKNSLNNVLMNLRKACDHPFLFEGQEPLGLPDDEATRLLVASSGKMAMLTAMLPQLLAGGHRVLIFSQLKGVLTLLEDMLFDFPHSDALPERFKKARAKDGEADAGHSPVIPFFRLDGDTKIQERQRQIDLFNDPGSKVSVFLMSTRAGGLGINLQSADTIIIFDSDFNPFADLQAEGRAHRLGQQQTVMVYQLFTAATVEERILASAARKRKLEAVVCAHLGRGSAGADLSPAELRACLTHNAANLMVGANDDTGEAEVINDADLARLLDRTGLQPGDDAYCADELLGEPGDEAYCADELLGEVGEGKVQELAVEAAEAVGGAMPGSPAADNAAAAARHAVEEAHMLQLLAERAAMLEQAKLEAAGRGKRARRQVNYAAESPGITFSGAREDTEASPPSSPDSAARLAGGGSANATPVGGVAPVLSSDSDSEDSDAWMHNTPRRKARKQMRLADGAPPPQQASMQQANSGPASLPSSGQTGSARGAAPAGAPAVGAMSAAVQSAGGARGASAAKPSQHSSGKSGLRKDAKHKVKHSKRLKLKAKAIRHVVLGSASLGMLTSEQAAAWNAAERAAAESKSAAGAAHQQPQRSGQAAALKPSLNSKAAKPCKPHDSGSSKPPRSPKSPAFVAKHGASSSKPSPLLRSPLGEPAWSGSPGKSGGRAKAKLSLGGSGGKVSKPVKPTFASAAKRKSAEQAAAEFEAWG